MELIIEEQKIDFVDREFEEDLKAIDISCYMHFRVTHESKEILKNIIDFCLSKAYVQLAVYEVSTEGKLHFHMIASPNKSVSTFGQWINKQFPFLVGNGCKSISGIKNNMLDACVYLCKGAGEGKLPDVEFTQFNKNAILYMHNLFWKRHKELCSKNVGFDKKRKEVPFCQKIRNEIRKDMPLWHPRYNKEDMGFIADYVISHISKDVKALGIRRFEELCNAVYFGLQPQGGEYSLAEQWKETLWGQLG